MNNIYIIINHYTYSLSTYLSIYLYIYIFRWHKPMISITSREVTTLLKFFDKALRRPRQRLLVLRPEITINSKALQWKITNINGYNRQWILINYKSLILIINKHRYSLINYKSLIGNNRQWTWVTIVIIYNLGFIMIYTCLCLRLENRTCVLLLFWVLLFVLGLGWGGGHVNVPCTSYRIYCHVAKISGIAYYVTCCYAAEISSVGWGWGGVGGMLTFLVLRTWYIAMLLRSLGSLTTWHVATLLRSLVWKGAGVGWGGGAC